MRAIPTGVPAPDTWILGSTDYGADFAARRGMGFAFARHINPTDAVGALRAYRRAFRPSALLAKPYGILALSVVCAESDAKAEDLATTVDLSTARIVRGVRDLPLPSVEEARAYRYDEQEEALRTFHRQRHVVGGPVRVREEIASLAQASASDEVMIMTHIHDHGARKRSYSLLAKAFGLSSGID